MYNDANLWIFSISNYGGIGHRPRGDGQSVRTDRFYGANLKFMIDIITTSILLPPSGSLDPGFDCYQVAVARLLSLGVSRIRGGKSKIS